MIEKRLTRYQNNLITTLLVPIASVRFVQRSMRVFADAHGPTKSKRANRLLKLILSDLVNQVLQNSCFVLLSTRISRISRLCHRF